MSHDHFSSSNDHASGNEPANSLLEPMSPNLQLRGMAERTQQGYLREIRKLAANYLTPPDPLFEQQAADYLLYLINDCASRPDRRAVPEVSPKRPMVCRGCGESGMTTDHEGRVLYEPLLPYMDSGLLERRVRASAQPICAVTL